MQKNSVTNSNPQDTDMQSKSSGKKELYICCHVRRVEVGEGEDGNENSGVADGEKAGAGATKSASKQHRQAQKASHEGLSPSKQSSLHG